MFNQEELRDYLEDHRYDPIAREKKVKDHDTVIICDKDYFIAGITIDEKVNIRELQLLSYLYDFHYQLNISEFVPYHIEAESDHVIYQIGCSYFKQRNERWLYWTYNSYRDNHREKDINEVIADIYELTHRIDILS